MIDFKIEYFKADYPDRDIPIDRHLDDAEAEELLHRLNKKFELSPEGDPETLLGTIFSRSEYLMKIDNPGSFVLSKVLTEYKISTETIYINWSKFNDIDNISIQSFDKYFDYLWYEGADDIELFDTSLNWVVLINHEGYVNFWQMK